MNQSVTLKPGTYTLTRKYISGTYTDITGYASWLGLKNSSNAWVGGQLAFRNSNYNQNVSVTFTLAEEATVSYYMVGNGEYSNLIFQMQLEEGDKSTDFEPYTAPKEYTISLDAPLGASEAVTRETGGDITLTDAETNIIEVGTTVAPGKIEVEYYRDINKVLENLNNAILAQGGNV